MELKIREHKTSWSVSQSELTQFLLCLSEGSIVGLNTDLNKQASENSVCLLSAFPLTLGQTWTESRASAVQFWPGSELAILYVLTALQAGLIDLSRYKGGLSMFHFKDLLLAAFSSI